MRFDAHTYVPYTWTMSDYGEPVRTAGSPGIIHMKIGWNSMLSTETEASLYQQYEFVGLTREAVTTDMIIDGKYVVRHVEPGRIRRAFMDYAEGVDRAYVEQQQ